MQNHASRKVGRAAGIWAISPILLLCAAFLVFRAQYSFCESDESFYLATVNRLYQGERLILQEWHPTQFYAPLLLPWYALYRAIVPSGNGILLCARVTMILISLGVWSFAASILEKECGKWMAGILCATGMLYMVSGIYGLSYYSLYTAFALLALCHGARYAQNRKRRHIVLCGICVSCAVLCMPYLAVPIGVGYAVALVVCKKGRIPLLGLGLTMLACAAAYVALFLRFGDLSAYMEGMRRVLSEGEHRTSALGNSRRALYRLWRRGTLNAGIPYVLMASALMLTPLRRRVGGVGTYAILAGWAISLVAMMAHSGWTMIMPLYTQITFISFPVVIWRTCSIPGRSMGKTMYWAGIMLAFCFTLGSNTGDNCMGAGFVISAVGAMAEMLAYARENAADRAQGTVRSAALVCAALIVGFAATVRYMGVYRDDDMAKLDTRIRSGCAEGLITTEEHATRYEEIEKMLLEIDEAYPNARMLFTKFLPWAYLYGNHPYATPYAWRLGIESATLWDYYGKHPEKMPEVVVVWKAEVGSFAGSSGSYASPNENVRSGPFWDWLMAKECEVVRYPYGDVYILTEKGNR